jgi:hypothetical protein
MFAGIDYLTLWSDSSAEANKSFYMNTSEWLAGIEPASPLNIKPASLYGTIGIRKEGIYTGLGDDIALLNVPGAMAQEAYCKFYNPSLRITRMDIQVTSNHGYNPKNPSEPFMDWYNAVEMNKPTTKGRKPKPWYITGKDSGFTLYIGSMDSEHFGRIYDKWAQSKNELYKNCIRWEIKCKKLPSEQLASRFLMMQSDEITGTIPSIVAGYFRERGAIAPWEYTHAKLWRPTPRGEYDYEKTLRWLDTQVAPSIIRLAGHIGWERILQVLGVDSVAQSLYTTCSGGMNCIPLDIDTE